jgi:dihydrofolate reductase
MRKLTANEFETVDGVMQGPGGPDEDRSNGFSHGGWIVKYWNDEMDKILTAATNEPYDLLLGRKTYEIFAAHWPRSTDPAAEGLNKATKYVASRTLKKLEWQPAQLLDTDVAKAVAELKRGDGPKILVYGSGELMQTLLKHGLLDELRVWTFPLMLGTGKRLFRDGIVPAGLELIDSATFATGVQTALYKTGAAIRLGSLALEPNQQELDRREKFAHAG